jgi:hypothetical protein
MLENFKDTMLPTCFTYSATLKMEADVIRKVVPVIMKAYRGVDI